MLLNRIIVFITSMGTAGSTVPSALSVAGLEHIGPTGYRMSHYRAPTPASVPGAQTLTTAALLSLLKAQAPVLIDVLAVTVRPDADKDSGVSWLQNKPRHHIPGSVWLPNVGYGHLNPGMEDFFRGQLRQLTGGDVGRAVVLYCIQDCWMSWNAARRAASYGYTSVYWYPEGSDGWERHGLPLAEATPTSFAHTATERP